MSKRKPLEKGEILNQKYVIDNLISDAGATCLVYKAHPITKEGNVDLLNPLIIKEFYPQNWVMISRNVEGQLDLRLAVLQHAFQREVENFCAQAEYNNLSGYDGDNDARYASFLHMDTFEENQTGYIVVSSISGATLETPTALVDFPIAQHTNREKDAVVSLIDLILRITDAVEVQHQAGFLNGDIKPDNLLVSSVGESVLVHLLDFGSCIPTDKAQLRLITPAILRLRLSQSAHYSSERLSSIYNYIKQKSQGDDETELYNLLSKLSPADDIYSICRVFGEMLFGKTDFDAHKEINDLQWLNYAEKACLCNLFLNGMNVEMETTAKDLRHMLKHLRQVLKREGTSKERFWASSLDYYEAHKGETVFRTTHKTIIPSAKAGCEAIKLIIEGTLNGEDIFPVHDIIQNLGDKNIYIQGLGGAGKSFIAAQLHKKNLDSGRKVPFYLDLVNLEKLDLENLGGEKENDIILQLLQHEYGFLCTDAETLLLQLQRMSTSSKKDYLLLLDNLHKLEGKRKALVMSLLRTLDENYKNAQFCILGRGLPQSDDEKECYPDNIIKLTGIPSRMVMNYFDNDQDLFKLPFFFMRAFESRMEDRLLANTAITPAVILYKYFAGVEGFEGLLKDIQFPALTNELINKVFPRMAYEKRCNRQEWHIEQLMSCIKAFFVDQDTVLRLFVDNLGLIECDREGCLSFTHDCYEEYFGGMYIAQRVYSIVEQSDLYATSKKAKEINRKWEKDLGEYAMQILNGVYFRESNCIRPKEGINNEENKTKEHEYIQKLSELLSEELAMEARLKDCYCKLPMNLCRNYYFDKDRIDTWFHLLEETDVFERYRESIRKWGQLGQWFSDAEGYNLLGMISFREKEYEKSVSLFQRGGESGCGDAYYNLGMIYEMGWGEKESRIFKEGLEYALENRKRWPMFAYENIRNCSKWIYKKYYANQEKFLTDCNCYFSNQEETLYWMEKAASLECEEAILVLGYLYDHGFDEKYAKWLAVGYYRRAVERGLSAGILPLANLLLSDNFLLEHEDVSKVEGKALLYQYAMKGNEVAIRRTIEILCEGLYCEDNYRKAVVLLNKIYDIYANREHSKSLIPDYLSDMIERYRLTKNMNSINVETENISTVIDEEELEREWNRMKKDELARMLEEYDQIT